MREVRLHGLRRHEQVLGDLCVGESLSGELCDSQLGRGERVAIISPNAVKMLIALWAVTGSGRVIVPINYRLTAEVAKYIVENSESSLLLIDPEVDDRFVGVRAPRRIVMDGTQDGELFAPIDAAPQWPSVDENAPASINYTSGTTASPKGAVLTQRSHWLNAVLVGFAFGLREDDVYLHTLPTFHVNGWGLPLAATALGVPQIIQREVRGPEILRRVDQERVTLLCGAMPVASTIITAAEQLREQGQSVPGDSRTRMVCGGAPTPAAVIEHFERVTGWEMIQAYGLTETGPVLTASRVLSRETKPADRAARLAAAGAPMLGVRLRVNPEGEVMARTGRPWPATGTSPRSTTPPSTASGSGPATVALSTTASCGSPTARKTSS